MNYFKKYKIATIALIFICSLFIVKTDVYAKEMTKDEIPVRSYVIGKHVFTREKNEKTGYDGSLTTNLIMLASKTIESNDINDMKIYYKLVSGDWIEGATGEEIEAPTTFEIDYVDLQLEEENNTVLPPKAPILDFTDNPLSIDKETDMVNYQLDIYIDDIDNKNYKVDGVELNILDYNHHMNYEDLKTDERFTTIATVNDNYTGNNLQIGKQYHRDFITFENEIDGSYSISARTYAEDSNGKKTYSDWVHLSINVDDTLPQVEIVNNYLNPEYISTEGSYYIYRLGIVKPDAYMFKIQLDKFFYIVYEQLDNSVSEIGRFNLDEEFYVSVPENSVKKYYAQIGYYDKDGNPKIYYTQNAAENRKYFIIDTRTLTAPIINNYWEFDSFEESGEYIVINDSFYESQDKNTLDYHYEGIEIYRLYWYNQIPKYELVSGRTVIPPTGVGYYTARVYATNSLGKKVYSNFSDVLTVVRAPQIEVSEVKDGKVNISIINSEQYSSGVDFNVYKWDSAVGEVLLEERLNIDEISIDVTENMQIYVRATALDYNQEPGTPYEYAYSCYSNKVNININ